MPVDCGTPVNINLARVQAEGGILQGIGMALTENIMIQPERKMYEDSLMSIRFRAVRISDTFMWSLRAVMKRAVTFGANPSAGVVINTPLPAIADAIYNATGHRFYELPITPEQIAMGK